MIELEYFDIALSHGRTIFKNILALPHGRACLHLCSGAPIGCYRMSLASKGTVEASLGYEILRNKYKALPS